MLLSVLLWLLMESARVGGQLSILDSFTATPQKHCEGPNYREGKVREDVDECALMCLMYDDCTHFQWNYPANTEAPCWLRTGCTFADHGTGTVYTKENDTNWLDVPAVTAMPGMLAYHQMDNKDNNFGNMLNMDENACAMTCLLTNCIAVLWADSRACWFKTLGLGSLLVPRAGMHTHAKAVVAGCVPGYSCYAILTYQNGQNKAAARQHCQDAGAHLAVFDDQEEVDAVRDDGRFAVLEAPLWLGIVRAAGQWLDEESGAAMTVLPWLTDQPAATDDGMSVTVDPRNSWGYATAAATDTAFPFCELPAITMTTRGDPMNHLNDADVETCYTPETPNEAAGTTLKTAHLGAAAGLSQILVKVQGEGLVCSENVRVWQMVSGGSSNSGGGTYLSPCQLTGSYMWQEKQLCLFTCVCDATHVCSAAYLRMGYTTGFSVCELQVM